MSFWYQNNLKIEFRAVPYSINHAIEYRISPDQDLEFEVEKSFADTVSNEQYVIKNGGHINAESGYTQFEEILKEI